MTERKKHNRKCTLSVLRKHEIVICLDHGPSTWGIRPLVKWLIYLCHCARRNIFRAFVFLS
jgi:hypothetical protein